MHTGSSDPFVRVRCEGSGKTARTASIKDELSPHWDEMMVPAFNRRLSTASPLPFLDLSTALPLPFLDLSTAAPLPFLDLFTVLPLPFLDLSAALPLPSLTFPLSCHCPFLTFPLSYHCRFLCLLHCLTTAFFALSFHGLTTAFFALPLPTASPRCHSPLPLFSALNHRPSPLPLPHRLLSQVLEIEIASEYQLAATGLEIEVTSHGSCNPHAESLPQLSADEAVS